MAILLRDTFVPAGGADIVGATLNNHTSNTGNTWATTGTMSFGGATLNMAGTAASGEGMVYNPVAANSSTYFSNAASIPLVVDIYFDIYQDGTSASSGAGVIYQCDGGNTYYFCRYNVATGKFEIYKQVAGTNTLLVTAFLGTAALTAGQIYNCHLNVATGGVMTLSVSSNNGSTFTTVMTVTDTSITTTGSVGLIIYSGTAAETTTSGLLIGNLFVGTGGSAPTYGTAATGYSQTLNFSTGAEGNPVLLTYTFTPAGGTLGTSLTITPALTGVTGTFNPATVTIAASGTSGTTIFTPTAGGTATIASTNSGSLTNPANTTYTSVAPTITADNAGFLFTGRWYKTGTGAAARGTTINTGGMIDCIIEGTSNPVVLFNALFDMSKIAAGCNPAVGVCVDHSGYIWTSIPSNGIVSMAIPTIVTPTVTTALDTFISHTVTLIAEGIYEGQFGSQGVIDEWTLQQGGLSFMGLQLDSTAILGTVSPGTDTIEFLGDSITASVHCLGNPTGANQNVMCAHLQWPHRIAQELGMYPIPVGFSSQGLFQNNNQNASGNASGNVPVLTTTFGDIWSGVAWSPAKAPLIVVISIGSNDVYWLASHTGSMTLSQFQTAYESLITAIQTKYGSGVVIECIALHDMAGGSYLDLRPALSAAATAGGSKCFYHDISASYTPSTDTTEGIHPNPGGSAKIAAALSPLIAADLAAIELKRQIASGQTYSHKPIDGGFIR